MSTSTVVTICLIAYLGLNFLCALMLHLHARRQAHLPLRFLDVAVHFGLLTLFAIPVLVMVTLSAMFGSSQETQPAPASSARAARAA